MRIAEAGPERLVVLDRPWFLAGSLWTVSLGTLAAALFTEGPARENAFIVLLAVGLAGLAWWSAPFQRFVFDRPGGALRRTQWRLFWRRDHEMPLARVRRARQQAEWEDGVRTTRLALELDDRTLPLCGWFGGGDLDDAEAAINRWLDGAPG